MSILKTIVTKNKPKEIICKDHKLFNFSKLKNELKNVLTKGIIDNCTNLMSSF